MFLWPGLETRGDAASASDQWDNVMPHDRSFFSSILICIMIFMKIISWKSEKENHNLKQRKISNQSLTMWNEHFRILNETCKKKRKAESYKAKWKVFSEKLRPWVYMHESISALHIWTLSSHPRSFFFHFAKLLQLYQHYRSACKQKKTQWRQTKLKENQFN